MTTCIGMSREFAEYWNRTATDEKFIYVEVDGKCGYVMKSAFFKDYPDVMSHEELLRLKGETEASL
jgi:hypothetical protein